MGSREAGRGLRSSSPPWLSSRWRASPSTTSRAADSRRVVQVGKVETISTTGVQCNSDSMPQVAQTAQQDPRFASLSDGLCYNYLSETPPQADALGRSISPTTTAR